MENLLQSQIEVSHCCSLQEWHHFLKVRYENFCPPFTVWSLGVHIIDFVSSDPCLQSEIPVYQTQLLLECRPFQFMFNLKVVQRSRKAVVLRLFAICWLCQVWNCYFMTLDKKELFLFHVNRKNQQTVSAY